MKIKALLLAGALALGASAVDAQNATPSAPCVTVTLTVNGIPTNSCQPVTAANPLPVTGGGGGGGGAITGPLGPSTADTAAVAITDTGTPITGQTISAGGQGLTGWLSQLYGVLAANIYTPGTAGTPSTQVLTVQGISGGTTVPVQQSSQYPVGSTPLTATATGTTAATTATLLNSATGLKTYLCGFSIRANATAAATGNATVTGVITATMNFTQWTAPLASGLGINEQAFIPCVPSSAINTPIAVVSAAPGTGGVVSVSAWGYLAP